MSTKYAAPRGLVAPSKEALEALDELRDKTMSGLFTVVSTADPKTERELCLEAGILGHIQRLSRFATGLRQAGRGDFSAIDDTMQVAAEMRDLLTL